MYVLDTSALVDAWNKWYSPRVIPRFWDLLEDLAVTRGALIPDAVMVEIEAVDDGLHEWCKVRKGSVCIPATDEIQTVVTVISNRYPNLRHAGPPGKNLADPIVIACARHLKSAVVTHEQATGNLNGPRIPDVCRAEGIRVLQMHQLVLEQGWIFR